MEEMGLIKIGREAEWNASAFFQMSAAQLVLTHMDIYDKHLPWLLLPYS